MRTGLLVLNLMVLGVILRYAVNLPDAVRQELSVVRQWVETEWDQGGKHYRIRTTRRANQQTLEWLREHDLTVTARRERGE